MRRSNLARTITATGKIQALTTVQVGTQDSGIISELHADFNSRVVKGQVIAPWTRHSLKRSVPRLRPISNRPAHA